MVCRERDGCARILRTLRSPTWDSSIFLSCERSSGGWALQLLTSSNQGEVSVNRTVLGVAGIVTIGLLAGWIAYLALNSSSAVRYRSARNTGLLEVPDEELKRVQLVSIRTAASIPVPEGSMQAVEDRLRPPDPDLVRGEIYNGSTWFIETLRLRVEANGINPEVTWLREYIVSVRAAPMSDSGFREPMAGASRATLKATILGAYGHAR